MKKLLPAWLLLAIAGCGAPTDAGKPADTRPPPDTKPEPIGKPAPKVEVAKVSPPRENPKVAERAEPKTAAVKSAVEPLHRPDPKAAAAELAFQTGMESLKRDDLAAAELAFNETIKRDITRADAYGKRGVVRLKLGRDREAWLDFREAVRRNPNIKEQVYLDRSGVMLARPAVAVDAAPPKEAAKPFREAVRERLQLKDGEEVLDPFARTAALDAKAAELVKGESDPLRRARELFDFTARRTPGRPFEGITAAEVFGVWSDASREFDHLQNANLYVAMARSVGMTAHLVEVRRIAKLGLVAGHVCAVVWPGGPAGKAYLVDPAWCRFGCDGMEFSVLDDLAAAARLSNRRAGFLAEAGELADAAREYDRSLKLDPSFAAARNNIGILHQRRGDWAGAEKDHTAALKIDPSYARAFESRAFCRAALGRVADALADYGKAAELEPEFAGAWHNRAMLRMALGDIPGAVEDFSRAVDASPFDPAVFGNRGLAHKEMGNLAAAEADFGRAVELAPDPSSMLFMRGNIRLLLADESGAQADFAAACKRHPNLVEALPLEIAKTRRERDNFVVVDHPRGPVRVLEVYRRFRADRGESDIPKRVARALDAALDERLVADDGAARLPQVDAVGWNRRLEDTIFAEIALVRGVERWLESLGGLTTAEYRAAVLRRIQADVSLDTVRKQCRVTDEQVKAHYERTKDRHAVEGGIKFRIIEIEKRSNRDRTVGDNSRATPKEACDHIVEQLKKNADFGVLASKHSDFKAADGGWWDRDNFLREGTLRQKAWNDALAALKPGEVTREPVVDAAGRSWHFFKLEERRDGGTRPLAEVADSIRRELEIAEFAKRSAEHAAALRAKATLPKIDRERLEGIIRRWHSVDSD